ncbi:MAG: hypothetical protein ACOYJJ_09495 [Anaerovoracaceae bacterium]|jgi:hypothetical protein
MCLIITAAAALIATIVWHAKAPDNTCRIGTLALMYWGAALMWLIDSFFSAAGGEGFFDFSAGDALLGVVIVLIGLAAWALLLLVRDRKKVLRKLSTHEKSPRSDTE